MTDTTLISKPFNLLSQLYIACPSLLRVLSYLQVFLIGYILEQDAEKLSLLQVPEDPMQRADQV